MKMRKVDKIKRETSHLTEAATKEVFVRNGYKPATAAQIAREEEAKKERR